MKAAVASVALLLQTAGTAPKASGVQFAARAAAAMMGAAAAGMATRT